MKTRLYIFKSARSDRGEESGSELRIIDVLLLIVWRFTVSGAHRSITATISFERGCL